MMKVILGIKKGMTTIHKDDEAVPVTILDVSGCVVALKDRGGVEIGIGERKNSNQAEKGKYKELGYVPRYIKFFKGIEDLKVGDEIEPESFEEGEKVQVTGVGKGKGFQGVVKRWGFKGGPKTHGQSDRLRAPGSIGAGTDPGRVVPGKKMPGRMGGHTNTFENIEVVKIADDYIAVKGQVPGHKGNLVIVKSK